MTDSLSKFKQPHVEVSRDAIRGALERAIQERGLRHFAMLDTVGEGRFFPNGMEERSGEVMDQDGRVWMFWTSWDPIREQLTIRDWEEADLVPSLTATRGYARARRELGLDEDEPRS
jgi:hypothetical protein